MPNVNKSANGHRLAGQDQRAHSGRFSLLVLAIVVMVIAVGFFMMLFTH
jgi:hypothetical protein